MIGYFGLGLNGTMGMRTFPIAQALTARGHEVEMFLPSCNNPEDAGRAEERGGIKTHDILLPLFIPLPGHLIITWRLLSRALRSNLHIVHWFIPKPYSGLVAMAVWFLRKIGLTEALLVMDSDHWESTGNWKELEEYTWSQKQVFAFQDRWELTHCHALAVGSRAVETLTWSVEAEPAKVFYVPNGLRVEGPFGPSPPKGWAAVLLYVRFLEFTFDRMVDIWQRLIETVPEDSRP